MRASGPVVPAAPVVSRKRSEGSNDGSIAANWAFEKPVKGGEIMPALFGAPPKVGAGRVV
jgi:hypothetical protein